MSAGVAPGSRRQHLWGIDNRCWRILSWTRATCIHSGSPSSFSLTKFLLKAQKRWGQTKVPLLPLLWEKAVSSSVKISVRSGNPKPAHPERSVAAVNLQKGDLLGKQIGKTWPAYYCSRGFKIENDLGAVVCCTRKWCKLPFSLLLKLPEHSAKGSLLYWNTAPSSGLQKWKDAQGKAEDLGSTWEAPARPSLDEQVTPHHSYLFKARLENIQRNKWSLVQIRKQTCRIYTYLW